MRFQKSISVRDPLRQASTPEPCSSYQTSITSFSCQVCETGLQGPSSRASPSDSSTIVRHNSIHRLKGSLLVTARAHIERIDENNPTLISPPSSHSLNRTSGSIHSPTRRCWTAAGGNMSTPHPVDRPTIPVTAPIHVHRSMSASFLDSVEADHRLPAPLDVVGDESGLNSPPRRLILVTNRTGSGLAGCRRKKQLKETGKSKSWDSYDLNWWKTGGLAGGNCRELLRACPKCSFPTTASPLKPSSFRRPEPTSAEVKFASEDRIERLSDAGSPKRGLAEGTLEIPQPPPAPTHRRSISLLTPLLRRREQSRNRSPLTNQKEEDKNGSLIQSSSPQHLRRTGPRTPQPPRKSKQSYLSSASSPFRQLFANSPLLSRRKNREKTNPVPPSTYIESSEEEESDGSFQPTPASPSLTPRASVSSRTSGKESSKDFEAFHRNQVRHKVRTRKTSSNSSN